MGRVGDTGHKSTGLEMGAGIQVFESRWQNSLAKSSVFGVILFKTSAGFKFVKGYKKEGLNLFYVAPEESCKLSDTNDYTQVMYMIG